MHKSFTLIATCGVAIVASTTALTFPEKKALPVDPGHLTPQQKQYCADVEQWYREEILDIHIRQRLGRPDMNGTYTQWCTGR
ncbi:hypothetical protein GCM10007159_15950 [Modicisalibacter luteus]|nr:hypothetical protein GCM10007159_15950 [Halomonas lutea]